MFSPLSKLPSSKGRATYDVHLYMHVCVRVCACMGFVWITIYKTQRTRETENNIIRDQSLYRFESVAHCVFLLTAGRRRPPATRLFAASAAIIIASSPEEYFIVLFCNIARCLSHLYNDVLPWL